MSKNTNLHSAKKEKNDEFYTQLSDIEKELMHYKDHFKNKVIFLNCDDPQYSNFWKYFELNFSAFGLKKLISTHFDKTKPTYKLEMISDVNGDGQIDHKDIIKTPLQQNGDFRSPECIELLQEADIVITNPPFSLFREYIAQLVEYDKRFLVIGNKNAITYKEIFPLMKDNKMWLGFNKGNGTMYFGQPHTDQLKSIPSYWYTNLDIDKRHEKLILFREYSPEQYPKYDNYDAINVDKTADIPCDYDGIIGVPITFMDKYCPDQFEILGTSDNGLVADEYKTTPGLTQKFVDDYYRTGGKGSYKKGNPTAGLYKDGIATMIYKRIFIRNKHPEQHQEQKL